MNITEAILHIKNNINSFEYIVFNDIWLSEQELTAEIETSKFLSFMKSSDGFISHIVQTHTAWSIDNSKSSTNFNMHTDGLYYSQVPEIVGLYCIDPWVHGATTYIVDTERAIKSLDPGDINILKQLKYTYMWKDWTLFPRELIEIDPLTKTEITNISARWFISPHIYSDQESLDVFTSSSIINKLHKTLLDSVAYEHIWKEGDFILFNNNKYLHGRKWNIKDSKRHLRRVWFRANI